MNDLKLEFHTGCVIKLKGYNALVIVVEHTYHNGIDYCKCISLAVPNVVYHVRHQTFIKKSKCCCVEEYDNCEECDNTGEIIEKSYGLEEAKYIAPSVKKWIENKLLEKFDF